MSDENRVSKIAVKILQAKIEVDRTEQAFKDAKKQLRELEETDMPTLMDELGFEKIVLSSGETVSVVDNYFMSIAKKNKEKVASWLMNNGLSSLISRDLIVSFGPEQHEEYEELKNQLSNYHPIGTVAMNTGSIKAAAKELMSEGIDVPFDILGMTHVRSTKIK